MRNKCELRVSTIPTSHNICTVIMLIVIQVHADHFYFGGGGGGGGGGGRKGA